MWPEYEQDWQCARNEAPWRVCLSIFAMEEREIRSVYFVGLHVAVSDTKTWGIA